MVVEAESLLGLSNSLAECTRSEREIKSNRILFDWLGFTFNTEVWTLDLVKDFFWEILMIPKNAWSVFIKNYQGYADSCEYEHIRIFSNGAENQGIHVDITGQGCRFIDVVFQKLAVQDQKLAVQDDLKVGLDWFEFLLILDGLDVNWTRIDVACDEFLGQIDVRYLYDKLIHGECTSKFKSWRPDGKFNFDGKTKGLTLYFGSESSRLQLCIYEKNHQLDIDAHWTRLELRFKKERAHDLIGLIKQNTREHYRDIGILFAGVLKEYLVFRDPSPSDSNKRRWKVSDFWSDFLDGIEPLKLASAMPDRCVLRIRSWINKSVSKSMAILFFAYQDINDNWLRDVVKDGFEKLSIKDKRIIDEFRRLNGLNDYIQIEKNPPK